MEKNVLQTLLKSFSAVEIREIRKFLQSPYFNQRQDVIALFECLIDASAPDKKELWAKIYGKNMAWEESKWRLLMSYLHVLLERYMSVSELLQDELQPRIALITAYRKRKSTQAFGRAHRSTQKSLEAQPIRNALYFERQYLLDWEAHQLAYVQNPTDVSLLRSANNSLDAAYQLRKLQIVCLLAAHQTVYPTDAEAPWEKQMVEEVEKSEMAERPEAAVYLHCYRMLRETSDEVHFQAFKSILIQKSACFSEEELHGLFILAINYCVRRLNAGDQRYYSEALELYKEGLAQGQLLEDGILSRFTYHNIVAAGLHVGDLEWVRYFINEYKNRLERRYRESVFSFNLARLAYAERNHNHVLELLQSANYRDPLHNLAAKTLLLKTFFDLKEFDSLQSHLDAMRNYIQRKRVLGYHRSNYLNIIRYAEKLLRTPAHDRKGLAALRESIQKEEILTEKTFFIGMLERL